MKTEHAAYQALAERAAERDRWAAVLARPAAVRQPVRRSWLARLFGL